MYFTFVVTLISFCLTTGIHAAKKPTEQHWLRRLSMKKVNLLVRKTQSMIEIFKVIDLTKDAESCS
jgi:hypothetical protein